MSEFIVDRNIILDVFLRQNLGLGNRGVKKIIKSKQVVVNGRVCKKRSWRLCAGDRIRILGREVDENLDIKILKGNEYILGVYKPPNIHSSMGISFPNMEAFLKRYYNKPIFLLNRLDFLTSGILLFSFSEQGKNRYKYMQDMGLVEKRYLALVRGEVKDQLYIKNKINDNKRSKVQVLDIEDQDKLRHTRVILREFLPEKDISLVEARIFKGKRHQIRAHLSYMGHPILGDPLYGVSGQGEERMYLHNFMVVFPDFDICI